MIFVLKTDDYIDYTRSKTYIMRPPNKVLTLEEDHAVIDSTASFSHSSPYHFFTTNNLKDFNRILAKEQIDVIILDFSIPGIDGFQELNFLKGTTDLANIPVIGTSTLASYHVAVRAIELGVCLFYAKPLALNKKVLLIEQVINWVEIKNRFIGFRETSFTTYISVRIQPNFRSELLRYCHLFQKYLAQTQGVNVSLRTELYEEGLQVITKANSDAFVQSLKEWLRAYFRHLFFEDLHINFSPVVPEKERESLVYPLQKAICVFFNEVEIRDLKDDFLDTKVALFHESNFSGAKVFDDVSKRKTIGDYDFIRKHYKELVGKGAIFTVFEHLIKACEGVNPKYENKLFKLKYRFQTNYDQKLDATISDSAARIEDNKIISALLYVIDEIFSKGKFL